MGNSINVAGKPLEEVLTIELEIAQREYPGSIFVRDEYGNLYASINGKFFHTVSGNRYIYFLDGTKLKQYGFIDKHSVKLDENGYPIQVKISGCETAFEGDEIQSLFGLVSFQFQNDPRLERNESRGVVELVTVN